MEGLIFGQSRSLYLSKEKKNCKFIRLIKTVTDSLRKENNLLHQFLLSIFQWQSLKTLAKFK